MWPQCLHLLSMALPILQARDEVRATWGLPGLGYYRGVGLLSHRMSILIIADALANHVPAGWPDESLAGSDSEELDTEPHLKVETKVSVELHRQAQGNHCGDRPSDPESGVLAKPVAVLSSQPQEQRKGTSGEPCCLSLEQTLAQHIGWGGSPRSADWRGFCGGLGWTLGKLVRTRSGSIIRSTPSIPS